MMDEEISHTMNLDLNLGPGPEPASSTVPNESVHFDDQLEEPIHRFREAFRLGARQRWRWRQVQIPSETRNISMSFNQLLVMANSVEGSSLQAGEGSVAAEEGTSEVPKSCDINNSTLEAEKAESKDDAEKINGSDGSFFDCNICFDLARDPVVTCCGHLFCWPCLYSWLHMHSDAKECPVCKGEVTIKNVTPIYGRGNNIRKPEEDDSTHKVPRRPHARRIESLRQTIQRAAFNLPMEEMIRRLGSRFESNREMVPPLEPYGSRKSLERSQTLLNRYFASNRMRREQTPVLPAEEEVDLIQGDIHVPEVGDNHVLLRRPQSHRITVPSVTSFALSSAERLVDAYLRRNPVGRNHEQAQPVDDRDSFSSIAAVINSESQLDTNMEIDSIGSLSTSSSRRRNDASRISDVDSGDSRSRRRRRLN